MPLSFMTDTVVVLRAPLIQKNGMEVRDWNHAVRHEEHDMQVTAQATSREFEERTQQTTDRRTLRGPYDADIEAGDRIIWKDDTYDIEGEVFHTGSPTGKVSSTRCTLVRFTG